MSTKIAEIYLTDEGEWEIVKVEPEPEKEELPPLTRRQIVAGDPTLVAHWVFT